MIGDNKLEIEIGDYVRVESNSDERYEVIRIVINDDVLRTGKLSENFSHYIVDIPPNICKSSNGSEYIKPSLFLKSHIDNLNKDLIRDKKIKQVLRDESKDY